MAKKRVSIVKTKTNGDIEYKVLNAIDSDMGWLKWSIIILFTAVLCPVFLKSLGVAAVEIVAGILAAIGIAIFVCLVLKGHFLGNAEAKLVESAIKEVVVRDAERLQQKVVKVKFCSDSLDSYGTIDEEYVLVLLSDKTVLKYPIKQLRRKDENYNHKLIVSKCEACKNEKQKEQIYREPIVARAVKSPLFISFVTWIVIVLILGVGIGVIYLFLKYVHSVEDMILPVFAAVFLIEKVGYDITMEGKLFILLTIPLIIATHGSEYIRGIILRMSPFRGNDHHYQLFMRELVRFVYTKGNLNFFVYASYFLFLFISTFKSLQSGEPLLSDDIDVVVAKSFLVFIACTNMLDRKRSSNLEGGELLSLFVKMMMVHDDEKWRMKRKMHQLEG